MPAPAFSSTTQLGPSGLWQYLGDKAGKPFVPSAFQMEIFNRIRIPWPGLQPNGDPYPQVITLNCGRQAGKTTIGEKLLWWGAIAPDDNMGPPVVRLTADTEEHARKIWDKFVWHLESTPLKALLDTYSRERQLVTLKNGANVQMLSANNPQALSGDSVSLWIIDEAQFLSYDAWNNLLPSTVTRNGIIIMLGVSEGDGPFKEACIKGDSPDYPDWLRMSYPSTANPYVPRRMIEFFQRTLPPHKFKQLILAQWDGELGKVFRNVEGCTKDYQVFKADEGYGYIEPYVRGHDYYGGLDLARLSDWSVYSIFDRYGKMVAWDRFSLIGWELQKHRMARLSAAYGHPPTMMDSTGGSVGDPVLDDLLSLGMSVEGYAISSNDRKRILVDELAIRMGAGAISLPRLQELYQELDRFEAKKSKTGNVVVYEAPAGLHDDWVMAIALAMQKLPRPWQMSVRSEYEDSEPFERQKSAAEYI